MVIRRLGGVSLAKYLGLLSGLFGLLIGILLSGISIFSMIFLESSNNSYENYFSIYSITCGLGAGVILPIIFGILGFLNGIIAALFSNLAFKIVGGLKLDLAEKTAEVPSST